MIFKHSFLHVSFLSSMSSSSSLSRFAKEIFQYLSPFGTRYNGWSTTLLTFDFDSHFVVSCLGHLKWVTLSIYLGRLSFGVMSIEIWSVLLLNSQRNSWPPCTVIQTYTCKACERIERKNTTELLLCLLRIFPNIRINAEKMHICSWKL